MAPQVNLSVPGSVQTPPTVRMATSNLLHGVGLDGALLERAESEGGRTCLLRRECQTKDGNNKVRSLCAGYDTALPEARHAHHCKEQRGGLAPPTKTQQDYFT
jgi:hypothetical protein